jgi:hypothetical protein
MGAYTEHRYGQRQGSGNVAYIAGCQKSPSQRVDVDVKSRFRPPASLARGELVMRAHPGQATRRPNGILLTPSAAPTWPLGAQHLRLLGVRARGWHIGLGTAGAVWRAMYCAQTHSRIPRKVLGEHE